MRSTLKYVGITHEQATVSQRSLFALNDREQQILRTELINSFSLRGLLLFFTCNRAEIYFESQEVTALVIKDFFLDFIQESRKPKMLPTHLVTVHESTDQTVGHLFLVANGLRSAIPGDKQVMGQLRAAYRECLKSRLQGSILERCMQHVFRSHKQVSNEIRHKDQNSTVQTRIMHVLREQYPSRTQKLDLLIIGAGAMVKEILPVLNRIELCRVSIANRTHERAKKLAREYGISVLDWKAVETNRLDSFDVIITAVSHYENLITQMDPGSKKKVLIDLGMPANINSSVQCESIVLYNIDSLYKLKETHQSQAYSNLAPVYQIIQRESACFFEWLDRKTQRLQQAA